MDSAPTRRYGWHFPQMEKVDIVSNMADALRRVEDIKPTMLLLDLALAGKQPEAVLVKGVSFSAVITILTNLLSKRS